MFGLIGLPTQGAYCATKAAVRSLSESLSAELAHTNVCVTSVHPGGIRTNIAVDARFDKDVPDEERTELADFFDNLRVSPEHAAKRIIEAIEAGDSRLLICAETYATDWMKRLLPDGVNWLVGFFSRRRALEQGRGAGG
jgi:short-subunit dehydrogenase